MNSDEREAICGSRWFSELSPVLRHELLRSIIVKPWAAGEAIFIRGQAVGSWLACASGTVRLSQELDSGRHITLGYIPAGHWFGEIPLSREQRRGCDAYAHRKTGTTIAEVPRAKLQRILAEHPGLYEPILDLQAVQTRQLLALIENLSAPSVRTRLMRHLAQLMHKHGANGTDSSEVRLDIHLKQGELAQLLGCSRQRLNQQLQDILRANVIRQDGQCLVVTDPQRLLRLASTSP